MQRHAFAFQSGDSRWMFLLRFAKVVGPSVEMVLYSLLATMALFAAGPDDFSLTIPASPESEAGRQFILKRAIQVCGSRYPQLGRYRFSGEQRMTGADAGQSTFEVHQELTCLEAPPPPSAAEPAPADWRPTPEDQAEVTALTERYFGLVDAGEVEQVHALWSDTNRAATPLAERADALQQFREYAGAPGQHRIAALTWYVNPPGAELPGIYVAADYERSYSGLLFNCGYIVWFRGANGRYVIVREETGSFPKGTDASPEIVAQARTQLRCPVS